MIFKFCVAKITHANWRYLFFRLESIIESIEGAEKILDYIYTNPFQQWVRGETHGTHRIV